jgi:hypothetical protein
MPPSKSVFAELVEALHFFLKLQATARRTVQPFDKLRVSGFGLSEPDWFRANPAC